MRYSFGRNEHLRLQRDFDRVFRAGGTFQLSSLHIRALPNDLPYSRLGLSVGRKHGNAVRRNRIKRLLREAYRLNKDMLKTRADIIIVPRKNSRKLQLSEFEPVLKEALRQIENKYGSR